MISVREEADWVLEEFGDVELGDRRRTDRCWSGDPLGATARRVVSAGQRERLGDVEGDVPLLENPAITHEALLSGHVASTWERVADWGAAGEAVVLAIQDTTELDFSGHRATSGLGQIGNAYGQGLLAHSTLACTASGVPLGLLAQAVWAGRRPVAE